MNDLARLAYMAFNGEGYGRSFETALDKGRWRAVAAAIIRDQETGQL
jgi:hypothetical protein